MSGQAGPSHFAYRPAIDGLRAIAVMLVLLFHAGMPGLGNGFVGVDVFFAISGYLITTILLRERMSRGRISFGTFYARRMRRLLPASLLVLVITAVAYRFAAPPIDVLDNRAGFGYAAVYLANWYFLARAQDYFAAGDAPSPVLHYWSLGVEEQFYLLWPLALAGILAIAFIRQRYLAPVLTVLAAGALLVSWQMDQANATGAYFNTGARAYQLLAGAALAAWMLRRSGLTNGGAEPTGPMPRWLGSGLVGAAVLGLLATIAVGERMSPWAVGVAGVISAIAFLAGIECEPSDRVLAPMQSSVAVHLGRWSYSTYLWHWPVIVIGALLVPALAPQAPWVGRVTIAVSVSLLAAWATFRLVEQPGQRLAIGTARRRHLAIGAGLAGSVACLGLVLAAGQVPASAARLAEVAAQGQVDQEDGIATIEIAAAASGAPDGPAVSVVDGQVPDPGPDANNPAAGTNTTSKPGKPSTVMLIGDSHAEMWRDGFVAAARRLGFTGIVVTESGCPWMDIPALSDRTGELHGCQGSLWKPVLAAARKYHPDVVIMASRSVLSRRLVDHGEVIRATDPGWEALVRDGVEETLPQIAKLTDAVVLLEPYPMTAKPMISCLSTEAKPSTCDLPATSLPGTAFVEELYREQAATFANVHSVSLDEVICPGGQCPAMVSGVVTFADDNHLTVDYAEQLVPDLLAALAKVGVPVRGADGMPVATGEGR